MCTATGSVGRGRGRDSGGARAACVLGSTAGALLLLSHCELVKWALLLSPIKGGGTEAQRNDVTFTWQHQDFNLGSLVAEAPLNCYTMPSLQMKSLVPKPWSHPINPNPPGQSQLKSYANKWKDNGQGTWPHYSGSQAICSKCLLEMMRQATHGGKQVNTTTLWHPRKDICNASVQPWAPLGGRLCALEKTLHAQGFF